MSYQELKTEYKALQKEYDAINDRTSIMALLLMDQLLEIDRQLREIERSVPVQHGTGGSYPRQSK